MLASIPIPTSTTSASNNMMTTSRYFNNKYNNSMDWPLNELEENMMTLATCSQIKNQQNNNVNSWRSSSATIKHNIRSSVVRCDACQRKFHSLGNLANHQQLYQH